MTTVWVAWESSNYWWNSIAHGLGAFVTSAGFAGTAAVAAALVAARQVKKTRAQDKTDRENDRNDVERRRREDLEDAARIRKEDLDKAEQVRLDTAAENARTRSLENLWTRFSWLVDRATANELSPEQTVSILASIRVAADALGDEQLADIIRVYVADQIDSLDELWEE